MPPVSQGTLCPGHPTPTPALTMCLHCIMALTMAGWLVSGSHERAVASRAIRGVLQRWAPLTTHEVVQNTDPEI